jgi:hypothetical protein
MRVSIAAVTALGLLPAALLAAPASAVQYGIRLHPTIYLCADDTELVDRLRLELPAGFTVVDGNSEPPPADLTDTTFAFIGHHDAAPYAAACIDRYPGATEYLYKVAKESSEYDPMFARYDDRSNVVLPPTAVSTLTWEQQGDYSEWFIATCFAPSPTTCFDEKNDPTTTLLDMAR